MPGALNELRSEAAHGLDPATLSIAVQLASAAVKPPPFPEDVAGAGGEAIRLLARYPIFAVPLGRAAQRLHPAGALAIATQDLQQLGSTGRGRLAVLVVSQPPALVRQASLYIGAAILHRHFVACIMKNQRAALQSATGTDVFQFATREVPGLYAALAELDRGIVTFSMIHGENAGELIAGEGLAALERFVGMTCPALVPLMLRGRTQAAGASIAPAPAMEERHCALIVKLLRRRFQPWSPIIG